jgi:hypothetical protein
MGMNNYIFKWNKVRSEIQYFGDMYMQAQNRKWNHLKLMLVNLARSEKI